MMNKSLSYKKSKRLAELGYKPDSNNMVVNKYNNYYTTSSNPGEYYNVSEDEILSICHVESRLERVQESLRSNLYSAPDCHDLLMELQKHSKDEGWLKRNPALAIFQKYFNLILDDRNWCIDLNPVEALGAALIKLLEEKQNGN